MQNDILVKKKTVVFLRKDDTFSFEFEFDALKAVTVSAFFFVTQTKRFFTQLHESFNSERFKESAHYD